MPLGTEVGLGPGHTVLDGHPAPPPQERGTASEFSSHVYIVQMAGLIKMPLGTEVGRSPGDIVLDGDAASAQRFTPPIFGHCLLCPNGRPS